MVFKIISKILKLIIGVFLLQSTPVNIKAMEKSENSRSFVEPYRQEVLKDLFFNVEPIDKQNFVFWNEYANDAAIQIKNTNIKSDEGISGMIQMLYLYEWHLSHEQEGVQAFAVYATDRSVSDSNPLERENIEMSFLLMTNPETPWTTHIAISRSPFFTGIIHKYLSSPLHACGAKFTQRLYPHKICMITVPVPFVCRNFLKIIPKGKIWLGDNFYKATLDEKVKIEGNTKNLPIDYENFNMLPPSPIFRIDTDEWMKIYSLKLVTDFWFLKQMLLPLDIVEQCIIFHYLDNKAPNFANLSSKLEKTIFELSNLEGEPIFSAKVGDALFGKKYHWFFNPQACLWPSPSGSHTYVIIDLGALSELTLEKAS